MIDKNLSRIRRASQTRSKIRQLRAVRLAVHRTNSNIYAQVFAADGATVLASASTLEKEVRAKVPNGGNTAAAVAVGQRIAEKVKKLGIEAVAFDRAGYKYHGRVKALADATHAAGAPLVPAGMTIPVMRPRCTHVATPALMVMESTCSDDDAYRGKVKTTSWPCDRYQGTTTTDT